MLNVIVVTICIQMAPLYYRNDSVIISSSKLFRQLIRLLPETANDWLASQHWFVPSQRTADEIHQAGFNRVTIMSGVQHEAVVAALQNNPEDTTHE